MDDGCPLVHLYPHSLAAKRVQPIQTRDERKLVDEIPNDFLDRFCDV